MADAVEAVGQRMKQEAADEIVRLERHDARCARLAIIPPAERNGGVVQGDEATVGGHRKVCAPNNAVFIIQRQLH